MRAQDERKCRSGAPTRLKRRAEFLRVGKGWRWHGTAMTIQAEARADGEDGSGECGPRFGFTVTKKVGNAVVRNRARRRLREAVRLASAALPAKPGHDYVIVGRLEAVRRSFEELGRELVRGLATVHKRGKRRDNARAQAGAHDAVARHADIPGRAAPERIRPKP